MRLQEIGLESLFFTRQSTPDLLNFVRALLSVGLANDDWKKLRKPETMARMAIEHQVRGGVEGVTTEILTVMAGEQIRFIENLYPYDALMTGQLLHSCLWSTIGVLTNEEMKMETEKVYGSANAVIFVNAPVRKSVHQIWHSHVVVDLK